MEGESPQICRENGPIEMVPIAVVQKLEQHALEEEAQRRDLQKTLRKMQAELESLITANDKLQQEYAELKRLSQVIEIERDTLNEVVITMTKTLQEGAAPR